MKRNLVLASLIVVLVASTASAQVTYQVTTTPTFVINTGRAEAMGNVRVTAQNAGPTIASTLEYLFQGLSCDNRDGTASNSGVTLNVDGTDFTTANTAIASVTNTSAGCVISVTVAGGVTTNTTATNSFIEIQGVRGRIDFLGGITNTGQNINASMSATPSNSTLFTVPNQGVVGITAVGLEFVSVVPGSALQCVSGVSNPTLTFREGFNGAFVQHVVTGLGSTIPFANRPTFGANSNTQIRIEVTGLPTGVTLSWPPTVAGTGFPTGTGAFAATTANTGSQLQRLTTATATSPSQTYEYAAGDQSVSDLSLESFAITPTLAATPTSAFGTATVQIRLFPDLIVGDATSITSATIAGSGGIYPSTVPAPRFNDPLQPDPGAAIATNSPCRTNLLFPFVANIAGFDTGIAIANTTADPFGTSGASAQAGTCTLSGWPADTGTPAVMFTTPSVVTGSTFVTTLSSAANPAFNGFSGYIIAVCDFQFAHGFAFITDNFGVGAPNTAQGYLALIIPDPPLNAGRIANDSSGGTANSGENLGQ